VLVAPWPVTIVYREPQERVLFHPARDANPVFHLMEALWMLAGRNDARWLDQFVHDFSQRFAEEGGLQHGAYGYRWRHHFDLEGGGHPRLPDQLNTVIEMLRGNAQDRRAVITMWDPVADLGADKKDVPCNLVVLPRVRPVAVPGDTLSRVLDITVFCRSNDFVWGATGANAVHFSVLQEYLAARIGVGVGCYYQIANNFHVYTAHTPLLRAQRALRGGDPYLEGLPAAKIVTDPDRFDADLGMFFDIGTVFRHNRSEYANPFFVNVAQPLFWAYRDWRAGNRPLAIAQVSQMPECDWKVATLNWMERRLNKGKTANG
jgi:thymidylate synthase